MKQLSISMPVVAQCTVVDCAYNRQQTCQARAITVGNAVHPGCDTFLVAASHSSATQAEAGVGACKTSSCRFNDDYECNADQISVGLADSSACCMTYQRR